LEFQLKFFTFIYYKSNIMTKQPNENSRRTIRRRKRADASGSNQLPMSRANRRAGIRLRTLIHMYTVAIACERSGGRSGFTKPGAMKRW